MNCINYISQIKTLVAFVCSRKKLVALSAFAVFVLICGFVLHGSPANANVCFLPDPSMCDDGETEREETPGGKGNVDPGQVKDICEGYTKSFSSGASPQNNCGDACKRCDDKNSPNFGKYLCPEDTCGWCDRDGGYTSIKAQNRCGDACEKCDDKFSKSFGKYKCPAETCDTCAGYDKTESQIKKDRCIGCVSCPYDKTRWKCTRCNICSGYQYSDTDYQVVSGAFDCEKCSEGDWYKCTPKHMCGDLFDYSNDLTSPNSETFNAYGKRHVTCTQCTTSGKYDTKYGYFYCQDDGCQNYNTHQSDRKITSGEYACCKCSPRYLEHDASLDASKFRINNGEWYKDCEEYCKPSENNFFTVNYLRNGKYSCNNVWANNYPDAIRERTSTIRLSCGNKSHSCYYPETICPVADYHWTQAEATAKANDDHYKKNPCSSCSETTSCAYLKYKCANPTISEGGCEPQTYLYHKTDFNYNYANNKYLGAMAGYNPDTCSKCIATGRSESSRLYAKDCRCVTVPSGWYKESEYQSKFYSSYGYSFSIASDYSHTTSGCAPIYSCGNWYYNYNSACMINHCNTSWSSTTRATFLSRPYATSGGLYGFKFDDTTCKCQYLNTIYYNSGSSACYNTCHWCALNYGYGSSYNDSTSWDCDYNCTDCANNAHYDCVQCKNGGKTDCTGSNHPGQWYVCSSSCVNCDGNTLYSGCSPKACPTGEVTKSSCGGHFTASGSYSGTAACGHCCASGYHWNGSTCEVDPCPSGTIVDSARASCYNYTHVATRADGVKCYRNDGYTAAYCDSGWSLSASTCYSSSKAAYCARNGEKCYRNQTTPSCGTNQTVYGNPTNCYCDCASGYCRNASGNCVSASSLSCPSSTSASCYRYESSTVTSGSCSKTCTYKVANTPSCGSNAHVSGSGTSCSCACDSGYEGNPYSGCTLSCTPWASESPNSSTCETVSFSCSNGCGGTRTCYKSRCSSNQTCYNSSCCTPSWPSYQGYDYYNCMTVSNGTVSDGCGNTATKYKSKCSSGQTCSSGSCITTCTPQSCSSVSVPSNASCSSYCTPKYSDCSTGSRVCTSWSCNSGYHKSGNSCVKDCSTQSCSKVGVPSNASCSSWCTPKYSDCSTGSSVCTSWSCNSGYTKSGNICVKSCTPSWPSYQGYDYYNCMTVSNGTVSDGCGGTATKYKSKCSSSQTCKNGSCVTACTPSWPSYQGYDYNNCMTVANGTVSDGCGNTRTKYKSKCSSGQSCKNGSCVTLSCSDGGYVDSCTASTSDNGCNIVTCEAVTYGGKTCYIRTETKNTPPGYCPTPTCGNAWTLSADPKYEWQLVAEVRKCERSCGQPKVVTTTCSGTKVHLFRCCT